MGLTAPAHCPQIEHKQTTITLNREIKFCLKEYRLEDKGAAEAWGWGDWQRPPAGERLGGCVMIHCGLARVGRGAGRSPACRVEAPGQGSRVLKWATPLKLDFQKLKWGHFTLWLRNFKYLSKVTGGFFSFFTSPKVGFNNYNWELRLRLITFSF